VKKSWWRKPEELDEAQKRIISLPVDGRYLITGPPGSGKTNLLLLRAMFLSASGHKDVVFLTVGRTLKEFIATGVGEKGLIAADQIHTYRSWVMRYLGEHSPKFMKDKPTGSYEETRPLYSAELDRVSRLMPPLYDAVLIDEVQDLSAQELVSLARVSTRLMIAGDARQQIFGGGEGMEAASTLSLTHIALRYHYRIGRQICEAADAVFPPIHGAQPLIQTCNYNEKEFASSRRICKAANLDEQVDMALKEIRVQLQAFPGESIGVFVPTNAYIEKIRQRLLDSGIGPLIGFHENGLGSTREFDENKQIFVMTIHSAKGTEFRAVHILGAEALRGNTGSRKVVFTAITRAKTSLSVYYSGRVAGFIASAFAKPATPKIGELF
jgi:superfamily I DNA and RNA helicase